MIFDDIIARLLAASRLLFMTHLRPDGDALGSVFGLAQYLREHGREVTIILPGGMPKRYTRICGKFVKDITEKEALDFDCYCTLDCANVARLGMPSWAGIEWFRQRNFVNIDHHSSSSIDAPLALVDPTSPSNTTNITEILQHSGNVISARTATLLMMGLMTDTGTFCFSNTTSRAFRAAAFLADAGADIDAIANAVFFSKGLNQLSFESEMVAKHLHCYADGRIVWAYAAPELAEKYHFESKEDEGLIDIARSIDTAVIAILVSRVPEGFRISMRSKDKRAPIIDIARKFHGGGHPMAAGATIETDTVESAMAMILPELEKILPKAVH